MQTQPLIRNWKVACTAWTASREPIGIASDGWLDTGGVIVIFV